MQRKHWCNILFDAYTYSSKYLIFSLSIIVASIIFIWIYERPQLYKLIFKKSKQSTVFSPSESAEIEVGTGNRFVRECSNEENELENMSKTKHEQTLEDSI